MVRSYEENGRRGTLRRGKGSRSSVNGVGLKRSFQLNVEFSEECFERKSDNESEVEVQQEFEDEDCGCGK